MCPNGGDLIDHIRQYSEKVRRSTLWPVIGTTTPIGALQSGERTEAQVHSFDGLQAITETVTIERLVASGDNVVYEITKPRLLDNIEVLSLLAGKFPIMDGGVHLRGTYRRLTAPEEAPLRAAACHLRVESGATGQLIGEGGSGELTWHEFYGQVDVEVRLDDEVYRPLLVAELHSLESTNSGTAIQTRLITLAKKSSTYSGNTRFDFSDRRLGENYQVAIRPLSSADVCLFARDLLREFEAAADFVPLCLAGADGERLRFSSDLFSRTPDESTTFYLRVCAKEVRNG